jgi:hypothetical protein
MRHILFWVRWALVYPAFILGESVGPIICWANAGNSSVMAFLAISSSSFGALLCSGSIAPSAKIKVVAAASFLLLVQGLVMGLPNPDPQGFKANRLFIFGSYVFGAALAIGLLFYIQFRRPRNSSERTAKADQNGTHTSP